MKYEVEMKFPVADMAALEARLANLGAAISVARSEVDVYFAHPARDFAQTDEALRLRCKGREFFITYKGPKIDATTKTRREIDLPIVPADEGLPSWTNLLEALGFTAVGEVCKSRRKAHLAWEGRDVEASLDEVEQLGTFAELELVVDPADMEAAKQCIMSLARVLELEGSLRQSYLELLLAEGEWRR